MTLDVRQLHLASQAPGPIGLVLTETQDVAQRVASKAEQLFRYARGAEMEDSKRFHCVLFPFHD